MPFPPKIARIAEMSLVPLTMYALSRLVSTAVFLGLQPQQSTDPNFRGGGVVPILIQPRTYLHIISNWDGLWYQLIATQGYPSHLSTYADGSLVQNQWAFYPGFPMLCRLLMHLGLSFGAASTVINLVACGVGCCLLYALVLRTGSQFTATMAVIGFAFFPTATVLQASYTESLAFMLIVGALLALSARKYGWFAVCALTLGLTRPVALPLTAVIAVHALVRWLRRETDPFPTRDRIRVVIAGGLTLGSFAIWPMIAAIMTGKFDAYYATELTWDNDRHWVTWLSETAHIGGQGVMLFTVIAGFGIIGIVTQRAAKAWPLELRTWSAAYVLYLLASTRVTPSITRYLMLAIVLGWPFPEFSERRLPLAAQVGIAAAVMVAGTLLQIGWTGSDFIVGDNWRGYP